MRAFIMDNVGWKRRKIYAIMPGESCIRMHLDNEGIPKYMGRYLTAYVQIYTYDFLCSCSHK